MFNSLGDMRLAGAPSAAAAPVAMPLTTTSSTQKPIAWPLQAWGGDSGRQVCVSVWVGGQRRSQLSLGPKVELTRLKRVLAGNSRF